MLDMWIEPIMIGLFWNRNVFASHAMTMLRSTHNLTGSVLGIYSTKYIIDNALSNTPNSWTKS
jgi:hypothetical protein